MKKINLIFSILLTILLFISCSDDSSDVAGTGVLEVTVNTSTDIWGYPQLESGVNYFAYQGDIQYTFQYTEVGGAEATDAITGDDIGDLNNVVYLYETLGETSKEYPVVYRGESDSNNSVITVTGIASGVYYVVAFYDYSSGGNQENLLNRYDRYAIYTDTANALSGNSTPYVDKKGTVEINDDSTTQITLTIEGDWVLGKPDLGDGGTGRIFLQSSENIPDPD